LPEPKGYSASTKRSWQYALGFAARRECLGAVPVSVIRPAIVVAFFDGLAEHPGKYHVALTALRQLESWALARDLLPRSITDGVDPAPTGEGHVPWTVEHVHLAITHIGHGLDRAVILGAYTGQRPSDLIRMGFGDIESNDGIDGITVRQLKTGRLVWVPIVSELATFVAKWERRPGPFLLSPRGLPWTRPALSVAFARERDENPALLPLKQAGLVLHGLRGHACVQLRRAGATGPQIADCVGMSLQMVERYCRFSAQKENAAAAVVHLERAIREREGRKKWNG
jgi:integrase